MTPHDIALARVLPRWQAAFKQERYYYQNGGPPLPFTIEQTAAIDKGATEVELGLWTATISFDRHQVSIDGNEHPLLRARIKPEAVVISCDHDSSHMDVDAILKELYIVTGIEKRRWLITVDEKGTADVHIAPSVAYIAEEIRDRPVTDHVSLGQWLRLYDVKASPCQLQAVFGSMSTLLPAGAGGGTNEDVIRDFHAPVKITLHGTGIRVINALGTFTIKQVLELAPRGRWFLHGVQLLPFSDVSIWRCCAHESTELHLYDHPHHNSYEHRDTVAGVLQLPAGASAHKAFVPFPTVSGNMFGDPPLRRVLDVVAAAPPVLTNLWLTWVNANRLMICFDHAVLMLDALEARYGRAQCIQAIGEKMAPGQRVIFETAVADGRRPAHIARRRYICYVQCIKDLLNDTCQADTIQLTVGGRTFPVAPTLRWSQITSKWPPGSRPVVTAPKGLSVGLALSRPDFILEELRSERIKVEMTMEPKRKRKRKR